MCWSEATGLPLGATAVGGSGEAMDPWGCRGGGGAGGSGGKGEPGEAPTRHSAGISLSCWNHGGGSEQVRGQGRVWFSQGECFLHERWWGGLPYKPASSVIAACSLALGTSEPSLPQPSSFQEMASLDHV